MYYVLYVSFPLDTDTMIKKTAEVKKIVGKEMDGTGAGFGMRDVDFSFKTKALAEAAMKKLKKHEATKSYEISIAEYTNDD